MRESSGVACRSEPGFQLTVECGRVIWVGLGVPAGLVALHSQPAVLLRRHVLPCLLLCCKSVCVQKGVGLECVCWESSASAAGIQLAAPLARQPAALLVCAQALWVKCEYVLSPRQETLVQNCVTSLFLLSFASDTRALYYRSHAGKAAWMDWQQARPWAPAG